MIVEKVRQIRRYADLKIVLSMLAICIITLLVMLNIYVERRKLDLIENSLTGYMGYLKNIIFSSTYDSLKKGNMKLFKNILDEIGSYEYVNDFSLISPEGKILYSSDPTKQGKTDSRVLGLHDKLDISDYHDIKYYFPVTTVTYCTRCHTEWPEGSINSFYMVSLSRKALVNIANFSFNTYFMLIVSGVVMLIFLYMFFYLIKNRISEDEAKESERKFRSLFENIMDVQYSTDLEGNLTLISPSGVRLLGYEDDEEMIRFGVGQNMFYSVAERREFLKTLAAKGEVKNYEIRLRKKDNTPIIVEMNTKIIYDKNKKQVSVEGIFRDITYRKDYEQQLQLMAIVFDTAVESIIITNSKGVVHKVNPAFTEITGYKPHLIIGRSPKILRSGKHPESFYISIQKQLFRKGRWTGEIWNRKANGEVYPEWLSITTVTDVKGDIQHYVLVGHDISELKKSEERLKFQAYHDSLTGLPNRELMLDRLEMALAYSSRHGKQIAILFIDLDNFKNINDTAGHHVGDIFLQRIAEILKLSCREEDTIARMGGDEFVILLPDVENEDSAVNVAKRIFDAFSDSISINELRLTAGASIGISFYPKDGTNSSDLLRAADMAMYFAKQKGKGNYVMYHPLMDTSDMEKLGLEADMRKALRDGEFMLYFQPVVSLNDGLVKGFESLIRWRRPDGRITMPGEFIEQAEQSPIILRIGEFVLKEACKVMRKMSDLGYGNLSYSINVSSREFQNPSFPDMVRKAIADSGIKAHKLILEITEKTVIQDVKAAINTMRTLKAGSVRMSLDDFGTGYSSLVYLKEFPISILKIDKTFTKEITASGDGQHITDAIVSLGKNFEILVIAEGVENSVQAQYLKNINCDFIQGFYVGEAMTEEEMIDYVKNNKKLEI